MAHCCANTCCEVTKMHFKFDGFEGLHDELQGAAEAMKALEGTLGSVNFKPQDPASVDAAIAEVEAIVDDRIARWRGNPLVDQVTSNLKKRYAAAIRERARVTVEGARSPTTET